MSSSLTNSSSLGSSNCSKFDSIKDSMLQANEVPLSEVVDIDQWQEIFDKHEVNFGSDQDAVYTPAITLWALISQAFFKGEMRSCKAAVGRVAALWATGGKKVCSTNTGAYCRARGKSLGKRFVISAINLLLQRSRCLMSRTLTMISPSINSSRISGGTSPPPILLKVMAVRTGPLIALPGVL